MTEDFLSSYLQRPIEEYILPVADESVRLAGYQFEQLRQQVLALGAPQRALGEWADVVFQSPLLHSLLDVNHCLYTPSF